MKQLTKEQTQAITDYGKLIRYWAQAKISPRNMTSAQKNAIKNYCKKDIDWQELTGSS